MKISVKLMATFLLGTIPSLVLADPKPRSAKPAPPHLVSKIYAGNTDIWAEGCNGGIYYSPNQQARAWCGDNRDSLGAGEWNVDAQGRLCHQLSWYWPNNSRAGKSLGDQACISHVVDRWGTVWRSWPNDAEWWPLAGKHSGIKEYSGMKKGYKFHSNVMATRSKLGL